MDSLFSYYFVLLDLNRVNLSNIDVQAPFALHLAKMFFFPVVGRNLRKIKSAIAYIVSVVEWIYFMINSSLPVRNS